ncbi:MAG TPA: ARMT1-like domain-containing protein [Candidatus Bathyarchaeia archaeon]|nr:ARMT1-like domain-containing protein [Candidatus Bathyarchaeia archaeon]
MPNELCLSCLVQITEQAIKLSINNEKQKKRLVIKFTKKIERDFKQIKLPDYSTELFALIAEETGVIDPFYKIKQESNETFKKLIPQLIKSIEGMYVKDILFKLILYSIGANMVDFSTGGHSVNIAEIADKIAHFPEERLAISDFQELFDTINQAHKIIYLSDNCGEVVIDNLIVEFLTNLGKEVYLGLKGGPVANDCTLDDFKRDDLPFVATETFIVSSSFGYNYDDTTIRFKELLSTADLLIVKGQSNYETTLNNLNRHQKIKFPPIFCILRTKCKVIAKHLNVALGSNIIKQMYPKNDANNKSVMEIIDCQDE